MHVVQIMYPREDGVTFNLQHYLDVHIPMGLGLLWKHYQVKPAQAMLTHDTYGRDRAPSSAQYSAISTLIFNERAEAERFIELFEIPEAREQLSADWSRFTGQPPVVVLGAMAHLDAEEFIAEA